MKDRTYIAIDLKSFYASVECRERGLDPLDTAASEGSECRTAARRTGWRTTWSTAPASIRFISSILPRKILWSTPSTRCSYPIAYLHEKRGQNSYRSFLARTVEHCQRYLCAFHPNEPADSEKPLFYTIIHGMQQQISADTVALFLKKYGKMAHNSCPEVSAHIHAHMLRHTRAMHLYHQRMPMMLLSE